MTTEQLEKRVSVASLGSGTFRFTTEYYGKVISMTTNDSVTYDIISSQELMLGTTYRQALQYAHDCVVRANKQWR